MTEKIYSISGEKNLGLGETAADQEQAAFYLRQFEICTLSDDSVEGDQWKYVLGSMFTGNPDDVYGSTRKK